MARIGGTFSVTVQLLDEDYNRMKAEKGHSVRTPRGACFSIWKIVNYIKLDIDTHEDSTENEKEISKALGEEKRFITANKIRIRKRKSTRRKQRKEQCYYLCPRKGNIKIIMGETECYRSKHLVIKMKFESNGF